MNELGEFRLNYSTKNHGFIEWSRSSLVKSRRILTGLSSRDFSLQREHYIQSSYLHEYHLGTFYDNANTVLYY